MRKKMFTFHEAGFTLIELLVVLSILGILLALSVIGMQGARESSRNARRKADLEQIRSGIEMYRSDCNTYPASLTFGGSLSGTCPEENVYITGIPNDTLTPVQNYYYSVCPNSSEAYSQYILCAALEGPSESQGTSISCFDGSTLTCGSCGSGVTCNYGVTNP